LKRLTAAFSRIPSICELYEIASHYVTDLDSVSAWNKSP
jgi:hypothetical protein